MMRVHLDQVVGLAGVSVRLRSTSGAETVLLVSYLLASPTFAVIDGGAGMPAVEPFGLLDGLPEEVLDAAREWQRHIHEVETGLSPDAQRLLLVRAHVGHDETSGSMGPGDSTAVVPPRPRPEPTRKGRRGDATAPASSALS